MLIVYLKSFTFETGKKYENIVKISHKPLATLSKLEFYRNFQSYPFLINPFKTIQ